MATDNSIRCIMVFDRFTDVEKRLRGSRECNILNNNVDNAELLQRILDDYYRAEGTARKAEEVGKGIMQITGQFSKEYLVAYCGDSEIEGMYENMVDKLGIAAAQGIMCALRSNRCDCADVYLTVFANYFNKAFETQRYENMAALKVEGDFERCREKVTEIAEYWAHKLVDKIPDDYVCSFLTVRDIRVVEFLQKQLPYVIEM